MKRRRASAVEPPRVELPEAARLFFEVNPQPMWVYDIATLQFLAVNESAVDHYGYSRAEFLAMRISDIRPAEDVPKLIDQLSTLQAGLQRSIGWRHLRKGGEIIHVEIGSHRLRFEGRDAVLVTVIDVTDRLALEQQLRDQAIHDRLTGLANQALFEDRVRQALRRGGRDRGPVAVLMIDLDDFKTVNDMYGRKAGDQILIDVAARLKYATRDGDTVARFGGDEFAVLLEDSSRDLLDRSIASIRTQVTDPFVVDGTSIDMTCTIGLADTTVCDATFEALVRCAGAAALDARTSGHGRFQIYEPKAHGATLDRLGLATDLRGILTRNELHVEYQPIVSLPDQRIRGAEALLRWRHPVRGPVSPVEFIPVAERTGLIVPIGTWVLRTACREATTWPQELLVSVNVSSRQLREPGFGDDVSRILGETHLDPRRLVLEVTESILVDDVHATELRLAQLRSLGVRIALDDFGAGYSSLGYLRSLPLDSVKIDRMFMSSLADRVDRRSLILGVIRLLQTLHVETVAEGIETAGQLEYMSAMGVDRAQGFYFAHPMSGRALHELLANSDLIEGDGLSRSDAFAELANS